LIKNKIIAIKREKTMNVIRIFTVVLVLCMMLFHGEVSAQNFAAPYLQFSNSSIASGMGNAYTALAGDASATYWNPAGLASIDDYSFSSMASIGLGLERRFNTASFAYHFPFGVIAGSFSMSGVNDIEGYDKDSKKTGSFNVVNTVPGLSYARFVNDNLSLGATVRYVRQDLNVQVDNGFALDFGARYQTELSNQKVFASAVFQNIAGKVGANNLPRVIRAGIAAKLEAGFYGEVDFVDEDVSNEHARTLFNVGAGYETRMEDFLLGACTGFQEGKYWSVGGSVGYPTNSIFFRIDYAYVNEPSVIFNQSHRLGLSISAK
jgi:long-subunit fatty acid transport protein